MTNWNDAELNPFGLTLIPNIGGKSMRVTVPVEVNALAYFEDPDGHTYLCAYISESKQREVYLKTDDGFLPVTDPDVRFIVGKWTSEIIESQRI
jgi:hypothetical protein